MEKVIKYIALGIIVLCVASIAISSIPVSQKFGSDSLQANEIGLRFLTTSTAVTTRTTILNSSDTRTYAFIQNGSVASNLYFDDSTTTAGVYLAANGSFTIDYNNLYLGNVYASSTNGTSTITVSYH